MRRRLFAVLFFYLFFLAAAYHFIFNYSLYEKLKALPLTPSAKSAVPVFVVLVLAAIGVLGILLYFSLDALVSRRIAAVSREIGRVRGLMDLSFRIRPDGHGDEISALARSFNDMLEKLEMEKAEREKTERLLRAGDKLISIGRLTSGLAHEINNPLLAAANGLAVVKKACAGSPATVRAAIRDSESAIAHLRTIISCFLDFHRSDKDVFVPLDPAAAVIESIRMLECCGKLRTGQVTVRTDEPTVIQGSKTKLKQVFINLLLNAAEASSGDDDSIRVDISRSPGEGSLQIVVSDSGPGVSPDLRDCLFEPFAATKKKEGIGLGLFVSRNIVRQHGGDICLDDRSPRGARFVVRLPLQETRPLPPTLAPPS